MIGASWTPLFLSSVSSHALAITNYLQKYDDSQDMGLFSAAVGLCCSLSLSSFSLIYWLKVFMRRSLFRSLVTGLSDVRTRRMI